MVDLKTTYAGLELRTPIIAASSGLTRSLSKIKEIAETQVGAIVLKSLFEEQIHMESELLMQSSDYPEAADYIANYVRGDELSKYLDFLADAKRTVGDLPIIASINCYQASSWAEFAKQIEARGADALEINVMRLESDLLAKPEDVENIYLDIAHSLVKEVSIPVTLKLRNQFTCLPAFVDKLQAVGLKGVVLFNRPYRTDIDIEKETVCSGNVFTTPDDIHDTLRFTALISALVNNISISTSTGVHDYAGVVKSILAGASAAQICSVLYKEGVKAIDHAVCGMEEWMTQHGYRTIEEFKGRLNASDLPSATMFERMQFMKYYSSRK